jgi:hypothetical protein
MQTVREYMHFTQRNPTNYLIKLKNHDLSEVACTFRRFQRAEKRFSGPKAGLFAPTHSRTVSEELTPDSTARRLESL